MEYEREKESYTDIPDISSWLDVTRLEKKLEMYFEECDVINEDPLACNETVIECCYNGNS